MGTEPVLYLGDCSCSIAKKLRDLSSLMTKSIDQDGYQLLVSGNPSQNVTTENSATTIELKLAPCVHGNHNCSVCVEQLDVVENQYRKMIERGATASEIWLICDLNSFSDTWRHFVVSNLLLQFGSIVKTIFLAPVHPLVGFENYTSLFSLSSTVQQSSPMIIRSLRESLYREENVDTHFPKQSTMSDVLERIAADLLIPLKFSSDSFHTLPMIWPVNVCSQWHRVFDVRSSLHYTLKQLKKRQSVSLAQSLSQKSTAEQLPYRVLASSIQHLNSYYHSSELFTFDSIKLHRQTSSSSYSTLLDYREFYRDPKQGSILACPSLTKSNSEIETILKHAAPGIDWFMVNDLASSTDRAASSAASQPSSSTFYDRKEIAVAAFQSPYGELEMRRIADSVRKLLKRGAYKQYFTEEFDFMTVVDSLAVIHDYLDR